MNNFSLIQTAYASGAEAEAVEHETGTEVAGAAEAGHSAQGLEIQPSTIGFQALNFVILVVVLNAILYKPLTKLLAEREQKIKEGVENADKAENMLKESNVIRADMLKEAKTESQSIVEKARKAGEEVKNNIIGDAHSEAEKIIKSGQTMVDAEKSKAMMELKSAAVNTVILAAEKILREKLDPSRDAKLIEESLNSYSA